MPTKCLKVRLQPTKAQQTKLHITLNTCRILYNRLLAGRKEHYEITGENLSRYEQQALLPQWKEQNPYLPLVYSQVLQEVGARVERSYQNFFRRVKQDCEKVGFPRFKGSGRYQSFTYPQRGFWLQEKAIKLSKIGVVKAVIHRHIKGQIKNCTICLCNGKWYACLVIDCDKEVRPSTGESIGIDVGLSSFATFSNGEQIENPRFYRTDEKALAKAQRRMSKFHKGTSERRRARKAVSRIHERIRNRRHNFVHQQTHRIVSRFDTIVVEKLNVKGMQKNHCLAKSIADASWTMFRNALAVKAANAGRLYVAVAPHYTSQDCSGCGLRAKKKLSERWHLCSVCNTSLDRDENAARNIMALGLQSLGIKPVEAPSFMVGE